MDEGAQGSSAPLLSHTLKGNIRHVPYRLEGDGLVQNEALDVSSPPGMPGSSLARMRIGTPQ
ncbi:MAG: hypothetical protein AUF64_00185 [Chloroflexi bacterium 13_1_20CM_54_36]|nr:MAG: hypothetical protein AUH05_09545 [Ktedonobacter sp. 13_2_20CM_53_11]OLB53778.1 MAG: hypothetical protein AUI01_11200 [Ktedonobacter sp. 13_2_20CM_2_56_8]OLD84808.1 MAG: hypothetical protein AUF64_00185 [Chloroflexi bacterium 13_1_20CM_54_36]OLE02207.1 MAG: hypothetical protein AUG82_09165 [Ktedonobacter sp. 13_1_20CM_4_53_11]OLE35298.1 MAG: hypothetical protein AUG45_02100 [Ktedonobacter sp. 13_1_20CM_3_54_15]TMD94899.1 MAG: hypothetical protein E6I79_01960 [Chloroflexota bacterium]